MKSYRRSLMIMIGVVLFVIAVTPQAWAQEPGRLVDNVCQPVDPSMEPRSLAPALIDATIQLTLGDPKAPQLFNLISITVKRGSLKVGFQFEDGSIGVTNPVSSRIEPGSVEAPQRWGFPGVDGINRLTLEAIGTIFQVDDIVIEPVAGGGPLTINFDNPASLRALPPPFTDAREVRANRYQQDGVLVLAGVDPPDRRLGGTPSTFYFLYYPPDVLTPCVEPTPTVPEPTPADICAKRKAEDAKACTATDGFGNKQEHIFQCNEITGKVTLSICQFSCFDLEEARRKQCAPTELLQGFRCSPDSGVTSEGSCREF